MEPSTPISQMRGESYRNSVGGVERCTQLGMVVYAYSPNPTLGNLTFKASLGYTERVCPKHTTNKQAKRAGLCGAIFPTPTPPCPVQFQLISVHWLEGQGAGLEGCLISQQPSPASATPLQGDPHYCHLPPFTQSLCLPRQQVTISSENLSSVPHIFLP